MSSKTAEPEPDWAPTEDPNATIVPGEMRSDREEIPAPFTKEDADKAETMEARQRMSRAAAGCQTYWPSPYEVCGVIRDKYNSLGGPASFLSFPNSAELTNPGNTGKRTQFLNGPIYWSAATGAHPVVNSFLNRWNLNGYETGRLKYPTTDEIVLPDGGRRQEFQQGVIYVAFQNAVGSALINGPLRDKYNSVGGLTPGSSFLGYPTEDQKGLPDGQGQMDRFQNGVIYWNPTVGAHPVSGSVLNIWAIDGYESGVHGYPIADMASDPLKPGRVTQLFQTGPINVYAQTVSTTPVADGYDCVRFDISGCSQTNANVLDECVQYQLGPDDVLGLWNGGQYRLVCDDFRGHINKHFADPYEITREDTINFFQCTTNALVHGLPWASQKGDGRQTANTDSGIQGFVVLVLSGEVYTAFTGVDGDGKDWGGCVRDSTR